MKFLQWLIMAIGLVALCVPGTSVQAQKKKEPPAGTAITLAEQIIAHRGGHTAWTLNAADSDTIPIFSHRIGEVPGTHHVSYSSEIDTIDITHTAHNRNGFALGAVLAAEFLAGKKGVYSMTDVLGL